MIESKEVLAEDGWVRVCPFDNAMRRAVWVRVTELGEAPGMEQLVEACGGREGDDVWFSEQIRVGEESSPAADLFIRLHDAAMETECA